MRVFSLSLTLAAAIPAARRADFPPTRGFCHYYYDTILYPVSRLPPPSLSDCTLRAKSISLSLSLSHHDTGGQSPVERASFPWSIAPRAPPVHKFFVPSTVSPLCDACVVVLYINFAAKIRVDSDNSYSLNILRLRASDVQWILPVVIQLTKILIRFFSLFFFINFGFGVIVAWGKERASGLAASLTHLVLITHIHTAPKHTRALYRKKFLIKVQRLLCAYNIKKINLSCDFCVVILVFC